MPVSLTVYDGVSHVTLLATVAKPLRGLAPVLQRMVSFIQNPVAVSGE